MQQPININKWIEENKDLLVPPVSNYCLYREDGFTVMVVGGPNDRKDYHINPTVELFHQLHGYLHLHIIEDGKRRTIELSDGDMYLLGPNIPHSPRRECGSVGLVVEVQRPAGAKVWYCEECNAKVFSQVFECVDLGVQVRDAIQTYTASEEKRMCRCGHLNST